MSTRDPDLTDARPLVVIGSGPAGVTAARSFLEAGGDEPVLVLSADADPPYQRPPLSKGVLAGTEPVRGTPIDDEPPPGRIDLRLNAPVRQVDADAHEVLLADGDRIRYRRLVLAPGSRPIRLPEVADGSPVHVLRTLADARSLVAAADAAHRAVVIGSGFIGCEAAASLARRGIATVLVTPETAPQRSRLGEDAAARIAQWLREDGVDLRLGVSVERIDADGTVHLSDGAELPADLVLCAVGVRQAGDLLTGGGTRVEDGRVLADEQLRAGADVWVAGDASLALHAVVGRRIAVEHWGDALTMGEIAGRNAALDAAGGDGAGNGDAVVWDSPPGFWSTIGEHTLKYSAWGDGFETAHVVDHGGGAFTIWYGDHAGELVGVLTHDADEAYERGGELLARRAPLADALEKR